MFMFDEGLKRYVTCTIWSLCYVGQSPSVRGHSEIIILQMSPTCGSYYSFNLGNVPNQWILPKVQHELNLIVNLKICISQGKRTRDLTSTIYKGGGYFTSIIGIR